MIGFVVVTHGRLGQEIIGTAELILGRVDNRAAVTIDGRESPEAMRSAIEAAIRETQQGHGVLVLTDLFGGTPSNLSLSLLSPGQVEVLSGVNLPMIIKLAQLRDKMPLAELAQAISEYGKKSINVAGEMLSRKPRS